MTDGGFSGVSRIKIHLGGHKCYWIAEYQFLDIPFPEQKRIAHTLNTARREITILKKLAYQYRTQKRALMQKLLSGECHVRHSPAFAGAGSAKERYPCAGRGRNPVCPHACGDNPLRHSCESRNPKEACHA